MCILSLCVLRRQFQTYPAATCTVQAPTPTCEKRTPPSLAFEQGFGPRMPCPAVGEDDIPTDTSTTTSSGGYSTSTFVAETTSSSSLATDSASLGEASWSEADTTYDDASIAGSSPLDQRRETGKDKVAPSAMGQADDEDGWHTGGATALLETRPPISHKALSGLIEDARMFANRLTRLAEGKVFDRDGGGSCRVSGILA